ncbi:MAG: hypothetical protein F6K11_17750, partial [Leptolyngbya sp. SIO3F4]|nr:hypothetical protein [Leptolyngbya sp. SIO3F4]
MKAAEVLRLYETGRRDFKGESLRGQNLKGKDLSGADFSGADIRSTNFTNANLTGANFSRAKAGLQRRWAAGLLFCSVFLPSISGIVLACASLAVSTALSSMTLEGQVAGVVSIATVLLCSLLFSLRGVGVAAVNVVGFIAVAVALVLSLGPIVGTVLAQAGALAVTVAIVLIVAVAVTVATTIAVAITVATAIVVAGGVAGRIACSSSVSSTLGFIVVLSLTLSPYQGITIFPLILLGVASIALFMISTGNLIGRRALKGDERDTWIHSAAIVFSALGGTSFYKAVLEGATFSESCLKSTVWARCGPLSTTSIRTCRGIWKPRLRRSRSCYGG